MTIPFLIYTDAPSHPTGLGRICRDLAAMIHQNLQGVYRVATLGVFGRGSAKFPWMQYSATGPEDALFNLRQVTEDFFAGERGVVFSITPPSWLFTLALHQYMEKEDAKWKPYSDWMVTKPFDHWAYLAIESHGPFQRFGPTTKAILQACDRRLYYSRWGAQIAANSEINEPDGNIRYLHHGIDHARWTPSPPDVVRKLRSDLGVGPNDLLLGCVATNSRRKLFPLLFESTFLLRHQLGNSRIKLWINTDVPIREYNLTELAAIFNFREGADFILTSSNALRPDEWLAAMYSACDLTCLPTAGEGFGYSVIESLSCGTPCVTTAFGAQTEFFTGWHENWVCPTLATHIITNNTLLEPLYDPHAFAARLLMAWTETRQRGTLLRDECREHAKIWDWPTFWPHWEKWFIEGALERQKKLEATDVVTPESEHLQRVSAEGQGELQATPAEGNGLASPVGRNPLEQGQHSDLHNLGGLDSGTPVGVAGEADSSGTQ